VSLGSNDYALLATRLLMSPAVFRLAVAAASLAGLIWARRHPPLKPVPDSDLEPVLVPVARGFERGARIARVAVWVAVSGFVGTGVVFGGAVIVSPQSAIARSDLARPLMGGFFVAGLIAALAGGALVGLRAGLGQKAVDTTHLPGA
jgi:hypothetical protein